MKLIIGGAYQGKLAYAKSAYAVTDGEVCDCSQTALDFDKKCLYHLEQFVLDCVHKNLEAKDIFAENRDKWQDSVLICNDISAGVVPMEPDIRAWREATGRLLNSLAPQAEEVTRMFCGLPQRLKG